MPLTLTVGVYSGVPTTLVADNGQSRLADAAGADQRDEARGGSEPLRDRRDVVGATDRRIRRARKDSGAMVARTQQVCRPVALRGCAVRRRGLKRGQFLCLATRFHGEETKGTGVPTSSTAAPPAVDGRRDEHSARRRAAVLPLHASVVRFPR